MAATVQVPATATLSCAVDWEIADPPQNIKK